MILSHRLKPFCIQYASTVKAPVWLLQLIFTYIHNAPYMYKPNSTTMSLFLLVKNQQFQKAICRVRRNKQLHKIMTCSLLMQNTANNQEVAPKTRILRSIGTLQLGHVAFPFLIQVSLQFTHRTSCAQGRNTTQTSSFLHNMHSLLQLASFSNDDLSRLSNSSSSFSMVSPLLLDILLYESCCSSLLCAEALSRASSCSRRSWSSFCRWKSISNFNRRVSSLLLLLASAASLRRRSC